MDPREKPALFVVIPEFKAPAGTLTAFLEAAQDDSFHSLRDEAGCRQFDVVQPEGDADVVIFYEVYDDRPAFEAHLTTPHLKRFQAAMKRLGVLETKVRFAYRAHP